MPIDPELYAAFFLATVILILMPGPIVSLVIANSLAYGTRTGVQSALGASAGNAVLAAGGALGLVAVMGLLADVFDIVRYIGAAYLIYLGIKAWRAKVETLDDAKPMRSAKAVFGQGVLVAITNPKTLLFYAAFFPQFVDPTQPAGPQLALLAVTFVVVATFLDTCYALLAGRLRGFFKSERRARLRNRITGTLLIGTGIGMALARRGS